jgi:hypothetical protein
MKWRVAGEYGTIRSLTIVTLHQILGRYVKGNEMDGVCSANGAVTSANTVQRAARLKLFFSDSANLTCPSLSVDIRRRVAFTLFFPWNLVPRLGQIVNIN